MLDNKKNLKSAKLDEISKIKNFLQFNNSLVEATKTAIKTKNNELALKMLENLEERPELWIEYLAVSILNENYNFTRAMIEKFQIDPQTRINPALIRNESKLPPKITENKELYSEVDCPLLLLAAIGGDLETFIYLSPLSNLSCSGHIALSRKHKNSLISNVLGAAAYYGHVDLLHYILEKQPSINKEFKAQEKRVKIKSAKNTSLIKENSEATPALLAVQGEGSEEDAVKILQLLSNYGADLLASDWNKDSLLHSAVKLGKGQLVKFLVEEKDFNKHLTQLNKAGESALALAKEEGIKDFLMSYQKSDTTIESELNQLIEETEKKKNKKKKKNVKVEVALLGASGWDEVKPKKEKEQDKDVINKYSNVLASENNSLNAVNPVDAVNAVNPVNVNPSTKKTAADEKPISNTTSTSDKTYERKPYYTKEKNENITGTTTAGKSKSNFSGNSSYYNYGYSNSNKSGRYKNRDYYSNNGEYDNYNYNTRKSNSKVNAAGNVTTLSDTSGSKPNDNQEKQIKDAGTLNNIETTLTTPNVVNSSDDKKVTSENSVKLTTENPKNAQNTPASLEEKISESVPLDNQNEESEIEENFLTEEEEETKDKHQDKDKENLVKETTDTIKAENNITENVIIPDEKTDSKPDADVVNTEESAHSLIKDAAVNESEEKEFEAKLRESTARVLELEHLYMKERSLTKSIETYIAKPQVVVKSQDVTDLLFLANAELEEKSRLINTLTSKIETLECNNYDQLEESALEQLRDFYGSKLSSIVAALNNLGNKNPN